MTDGLALSDSSAGSDGGVPTDSLSFDSLFASLSSLFMRPARIDSRIAPLNFDVFVTIRVSVQQEVIKENAYDAIYKLSNPHQQIDSYISNVIRGEVPKLKLDDVFTQKNQLAKVCLEDLQTKMKEFGWFIHNVLVTDIEPAAIVKNAMNEKEAMTETEMRYSRTKRLDGCWWGCITGFRSRGPTGGFSRTRPGIARAGSWAGWRCSRAARGLRRWAWRPRAPTDRERRRARTPAVDSRG